MLIAPSVLNAGSSKTYFSGCLIYENSFRVIEPIGLWHRLAHYVGYYDKNMFAMQALVGMETLYYISNDNYKSYTESKMLVQIYIGITNKYYSFAQGRALPSIDATVGTNNAIITPLAQTATIAGYLCQSLQIVDNGITTIYFYSPKVCVNQMLFANHRYGNWGVYLKASRGALPLRFIVKNIGQGYEWTSEVKSVRRMQLSASDFTDSVPAR